MQQIIAAARICNCPCSQMWCIIISTLFYRIYAKTRKKRSVNFYGVIMKSQVITQVVVSYMLLFVHFLTNFEQKQLDFISFHLFSWLFKQQNLVNRTLCKLTKQSWNTSFWVKGLDFDHFSLDFMTSKTSYLITITLWQLMLLPMCILFIYFNIVKSFAEADIVDMLIFEWYCRCAKKKIRKLISKPCDYFEILVHMFCPHCGQKNITISAEEFA